MRSGKLLGLRGIGNDDDRMIFRNEAASADHPCLTYHGADKPALLSPIAGALQDDRVGAKNSAAALGNFGEPYVARVAVLRQTFFVGAHVMGPKKRNFVRSWLSADAVAMLLAIPDEVAGLRQIAIVAERRQCRLKQRLRLCHRRAAPKRDRSVAREAPTCQDRDWAGR